MFNSSCVVMIPARVRTLLGVLLLAVASPAQKGCDMPQLIDKVMLQAAERYADMASGLKKGKMPRTFSGGRLVQADIGWWCSGFYPGTLWKNQGACPLVHGTAQAAPVAQNRPRHRVPAVLQFRQRIPPYRRHGLPRCIAQGGRHSCGTL